MRLQERAIVAPSAKLMLVALLVTLADEEARSDGGPTSGILMGAALLKRLAQLSLGEVHRLAESGALELVVRYDGDQVAWSLQAATRKHAEQALLEHFMRHGAPRALLRELFRISRTRIDAVRRSLRLSSTEGRPKLPRRRDREAIVAAWSELARTEPDRRLRYRELHGAFPRYSIAALDAVVRESSLESPEKRPAYKPVSAPHERGVRTGDPPARTVVHRRDPK